MKWHSYNYKGLSIPSKKLALKWLLNCVPSDMILLQENLVPFEQIVRTLQSILLGWHLQDLDAAGRSGGLDIGINPLSIKVISSWGGQGFLGMDILLEELGKQLRIINIYAPNQNRLAFQQTFLENLMINHPTILWGDLNFSIVHEESWGRHSQLDPLSNQLNTLLEQYGLIDVPMNKNMPTWHTRWIGEATLGRRLERYLIQEDLLQSLTIYRQWVGSGGISDHSPIYLEVALSSRKPRVPYKFNSTWLKDPDYIKMVSQFQKAQPQLMDQRKTKGFCSNPKQLKRLTIEWEKRKKSRDEHILVHIQSQVASLMDECGKGFISIEVKLHLVEMEAQRSKILLDQE